MKIKKTIKKKAAKKTAKKSAKKAILLPKAKNKIAKKKPAVAKRTLKSGSKDILFERVQDLRDAVERLPDLALPGAPVELPKDLAESNPTREPEIIPKRDIFPEIAVTPKPAYKAASHTPKNKGGRQGVWVAVVSTFSVILVIWATTLGGSTIFPGTADSGSDFDDLRAEWEGAAQTLRDSLETLSAKLETAQAKDEPKPSEEVLQAIGARVIFEAAQAASGTDKK